MDIKLNEIDSRKAKDIEERIRALAENYTPEWHFDSSDPDIGSAICKLYARQVQENIGLINQVMDRYHAELINLLDLSLKPARPAGSMVYFDMIKGVVPGTRIAKGTQLLADNTDGGSSPVIFETDRDLYVTNSSIVDVFMTRRRDGSVIPVMGDFSKQPIFPSEFGGGGQGARRQNEEDAFGQQVVPPFTLFGEGESITRSVLCIYHKTLFDVEGEPIYIRLTGGEGIVRLIEEGRLKFRYYTENGFEDLQSVELMKDGETYKLFKDKVNKKITLEDGHEYALFILEAVPSIPEVLNVRTIGLSSGGRPRQAEFINDSEAELDVDLFLPFTDTLSVYGECYIGHDLYFSKAGAHVALDFEAEFEEHRLFLTPEEEMEELKVIKRKPISLPVNGPAVAHVDQIALEYFNGTGWKRLRCDRDVSRIFQEEKPGEYHISFIAPDDWESTGVGAFTGRCIRLRLMKSENCYMRPGIHYYPIIKKMRISYTYEGHFRAPDCLRAVSGTRAMNLDLLAKKGEDFTVFAGSGYLDDALYLGFDRRIEEGPASLFIDLKDMQHQMGMHCFFEYSGPKGFRRMKVLDDTASLSRSGMVMFVPPPDMHAVTLEGKHRYWIRIVRAQNRPFIENEFSLPRIAGIRMNVIPVTNVITHQTDSFYVDDPMPSMHFPLNAENILDAEVWVNERGSFSQEEALAMLSDNPDSVRAEYDSLGNISNLFVKWEETDSFDVAEHRRVYLIDRVEDEIIFGDGISSDIPRVTDGLSFTVRVRSTDGERGNVPVQSINETAATEIFLEGVTNPVSAFGGGNMETVRQALRRGDNMMHRRNRLVSLGDYERTIRGFSDSIDKVSGIVGETLDGIKDPANISFVLLMKDFMEGSYSFHRVSGDLKNYIEEACEITISHDHIHIVEPVFVSISVHIWTEVARVDDSFEIRNLVKDSLTEYLNPVSSEGHQGWPIGVLPKKSQILMRLSSLKSRMIVRKIAMIARYDDHLGRHEKDLMDLVPTPFMVACSGEHHVSVNYV